MNHPVALHLLVDYFTDAHCHHFLFSVHDTCNHGLNAAQTNLNILFAVIAVFRNTSSNCKFLNQDHHFY